MSAEHVHSKLLTSAAKAELGALGMRRKGRSRTWIDDRGWWLGVVEFQPSSYSRGTYLNVGVHWLWEGSPHLTLSVSERVRLEGGEHHGQWFEFESEEQFAPVARHLATEAADRIMRFRADFANPASAARCLADGEPTLLEALDAGVAYGLAGDPSAARPLFERYLAWAASQEQTSPRDVTAQARLDAVDDTAAFNWHGHARHRSRARRTQARPDVRVLKSYYRSDPNDSIFADRRLTSRAGPIVAG